MASPPSLVTSTALELGEKLQAGSLTSVELAEACLEQIEKHNKHLNALISICPRHVVLAKAEELDKERQAGRIRSRLHGIPIVVKNTFVTSSDLEMPTTVGSFVFASMTAARSAPVIEKLLDAGLILLGKANMTEFCGLKSNNTPVGWSAYGGQTQYPYRLDGLSEAEQPTAGGSSSGSAVSLPPASVRWPLAPKRADRPLYPAILAGLYAMKPTPGRASTVGVFSLSAGFDSFGIMARDPQDLVELANVIIDGSVQAMRRQAVSSVPRSPALTVSRAWAGLSIGVTDVLWGIHETGRDKWGHSHVVDHEFPSEVAKFAENFESEEGGTIGSLEDVIHWNKEHARQALPEPYTTRTESEAAVQTAVAGVRRLAGKDGIGKAMDDAAVEKASLWLSACS